jgi:hypothetical protein
VVEAPSEAAATESAAIRESPSVKAAAETPFAEFTPAKALATESSTAKALFAPFAITKAAAATSASIIIIVVVAAPLGQDKCGKCQGKRHRQEGRYGSAEHVCCHPLQL